MLRTQGKQRLVLFSFHATSLARRSENTRLPVERTERVRVPNENLITCMNVLHHVVCNSMCVLRTTCGTCSTSVVRSTHTVCTYILHTRVHTSTILVHT